MQTRCSCVLASFYRRDCPAMRPAANSGRAAASARDLFLTGMWNPAIHHDTDLEIFVVVPIGRRGEDESFYCVEVRTVSSRQVISPLSEDSDV